MGYASVFPFTFNSTYLTGTAFTTDISLSTIATDKPICSVQTMNYTSPIQYAFAEITAEASRDTSHALNYTDDSDGSYLDLDDGTTHKNAGFVYSKHFVTPADGQSGFCWLPMRVNLASYLKPNTEYICTIKNAKALGNNLLIYQPIVNIKLYGSV